MLLLSLECVCVSGRLPNDREFFKHSMKMKDNDTVCSDFVDALTLIDEAERAYLDLNQLTQSSPEFTEPEAFCRNILKDIFRTANLTDHAAQRKLLVWACDQRPRARLVPALACVFESDCGDAEAARQYAERALNVQASVLFAQQLWLRFAPKGTPRPDPNGRFCRVPFERLETMWDGNAHFCCVSWLPARIGKIDSPSAGHIWNSEAAKDIRRSILDGSYRYCSRLYCPEIANGTLPRNQDVKNTEHRRIIENRTDTLPQGPTEVMLSHDRSCNLSCPSCRTGMIVAKRAEQDRLDSLADRVIMPLLRKSRRVRITGSGDPFGSAHFRHIMKKINRKDFPDLRIDLHTNGQLFDEKSWKDLELSGLCNHAYISIDAAREETYAVVRRGGTLSRLLRNLAFISQLKQEGELSRVRLDFVVQKANFREMPDVVDLAKTYGFDGVKFQMIRNWGTYGPDVFVDHFIGSPDHPDYPLFLEVLQDPRLQDSFTFYYGLNKPLVDAGNARAPAYLRPARMSAALPGAAQQAEPPEDLQRAVGGG